MFDYYITSKNMQTNQPSKTEQAIQTTIKKKNYGTLKKYFNEAIKNKVIDDNYTLDNLEKFHDILKKELEKNKTATKKLSESRKDGYEEVDSQL